MAHSGRSGRAFATRTVHHPDAEVASPPVAAPLYQTSTFRAADAATIAGYAAEVQPQAYYTRWGNPTIEILEKVVADLEGGPCGLAFASGMAAVSTTLLGLLSPGDHVVAGVSLYTATTTLLAQDLHKLGIEVDFVDPTDSEAFARAARHADPDVLSRNAHQSHHALNRSGVGVPIGRRVGRDRGGRQHVRLALQPAAAGRRGRRGYPQRHEVHLRPHGRDRRLPGDRRRDGRATLAQADPARRQHGPVCRLAYAARRQDPGTADGTSQQQCPGGGPGVAIPRGRFPGDLSGSGQSPAARTGRQDR